MAPSQPDPTCGVPDCENPDHAPQDDVREPDLVLTFEEAAARLKVKESWLRLKVTARAVPHARLGRQIRFTEEHLAQIVAAAEEPPVTPRRRLRNAS